MNKLGVTVNTLNTVAAGMSITEAVSPQTLDLGGNVVGSLIEQYPLVSTLFFAGAALSGWVQMARSARANNLE